MELMQTIIARRSIRRFKPDPVPGPVLAEMLEAARLAPSGGNDQGHVFGVVTDAGTKHRLALAAGSQMWIADAPIVIACCAELDWDLADQPETDFGRQVNDKRFGRDFIRYLCAYPDKYARMRLFENATPLIPMEHISLVAASYGLGSCMVGLLDVERVDRILNLPPHISCLFLLPVGYPAATPGKKHTKSLEEIVFHETWPESGRDAP